MSDAWGDPAAKRWSKHVINDLVPKLEGSGAVISIVPTDNSEGDVKFWVELGASIMLDKPLIIVVSKGQPVPAKLRKVADEVVEIESWEDLGPDSGLIQAAVVRVMDWGKDDGD